MLQFKRIGKRSWSAFLLFYFDKLPKKDICQSSCQLCQQLKSKKRIAHDTTKNKCAQKKVAKPLHTGGASAKPVLSRQDIYVLNSIIIIAERNI